MKFARRMLLDSRLRRYFWCEKSSANIGKGSPGLSVSCRVLQEIGREVGADVRYLETERLLFRDHETQDLDPFCAMEADPEVRRYVGGAPRSRDRAEAKFRDVYLQPVPDRMALWATVYKPKGGYIGYCGVYPHFDQHNTPIPREGVLAFYLARAYWGQGLATEAGQAFLRFGFEDLDLTRIIATVHTGHNASMRVLEKLGFTRVEANSEDSRSYHYYELPRKVWSRTE